MQTQAQRVRQHSRRQSFAGDAAAASRFGSEASTDQAAAAAVVAGAVAFEQYRGLKLNVADMLDAA